MHTDLITNEDGQRTQVGPDPLDYVLRYAASDYDCYLQGRYIGSRPTLPKAVAAIEEEQAKATRHPQPVPAADATLATYHEELRAIAARLHDLAHRLSGHPAEQAPLRAQLTMAHIRISTALRSLQDAERSLGLAGQMTDVAAPLDAQLVTPIPAAGVRCWRIDGDLIKWVDLVRHGVQSRRFAIPAQADHPQQRAA